MRRGTLVRLVAVGLAAGAAALIVALFVPWLPDQASEERERIDLVFWVTTGICIFVFGIVAGVSVYAVWKFRARPDDDSDGPPIHGHTGLEILWTAIPAALVTVIATISAVALAKNDSLPSDRLTVEVTARQFAWSFAYPDAKGLTSAQLRLPLNRPVELKIRSLDVIHSFWVPEFGQKQDALPASRSDTPFPAHLKVTPTKLGRFPVICTELCGLGHAYMRSYAIVMRPQAFDRWVSQQGKQQGGGGAAAGASLFQQNGCGSCHTFKPANATATVGPDLGKLPEYAQRAGKPLDAFVRESIQNPGAYVEKGFPANTMPSFSQLPNQQLDALVQYLTAKGG